MGDEQHEMHAKIHALSESCAQLATVNYKLAQSIYGQATLLSALVQIVNEVHPGARSHILLRLRSDDEFANNPALQSFATQLDRPGPLKFAVIEGGLSQTEKD